MAIGFQEKDTFKRLQQSLVSHKGVAFTNRFVVMFPTPDFSTLSTNFSDLENLVLKTSQDVIKFFNDPASLSVLCMGAKLPISRLATIDYRDVRQAYKIANGFVNEDVTFSFIVTNDHYAPRFFKAWQLSVINKTDYTANFFDDYAKDVKIYTMDGMNFVHGAIVLENAYPTDVSFSQLSDQDSDYLRVDVTMTYKDFHDEVFEVNYSQQDLLAAMEAKAKDVIGETYNDTFVNTPGFNPNANGRNPNFSPIQPNFSPLPPVDSDTIVVTPLPPIE